jgi:Catalase/C-terminal domain found in long catalases
MGMKTRQAFVPSTVTRAIKPATKRVATEINRINPQQGNFDIVGNNIPVFFIQDAIKFPDLVHAVKPEPHNEIQDEAGEFVSEAYKHCKTIAASGAGVGFLATTLAGKFSESDAAGDRVAVNEGVVTTREGSIKDVVEAFFVAIALHRHWEREPGP